MSNPNIMPLEPFTQEETRMQQTYANQGACRRAAKKALTEAGIESPERKVHFDMRVDEEGRWSWFKLSPKAPIADPETTPVSPKAKKKAAKKSTKEQAQEITREEWLREMAHRLHTEVFLSHLNEMGLSPELPKMRVSCGFPANARVSGNGPKAIGQCHSEKNSADGTTEMFVSPSLDDPMRVAGVLAHEMVHMYVGIEAGHKGPFKTLATAIGLEGKMTATTEGEAFQAALQPILEDMGPYPHAALNLSGRKKVGTYLIKVSCQDKDECGTVYRITQKYIEQAGGQLTCPVCQGACSIG